MAEGPEGSDLVARSDERAAIQSLLGDSGPPVLVLTGPAGAGKTAVWEWGLGHAAAVGWRVLRTRCAASEAVLPWVDVSDLLEHCRDDVWASLPEPQRDAMDVVMLRARAGAAAPDERAVGTTLLSAFAALGRDGPVLVAIDDVGHLDPASAKAIRFALRRLDASMPVRVLATSREPSVGPLDVRDDVARVAVGPLSLAGVFELIRRRLGTSFTRPVLVRIFETSGGNALYALELARAIGRREIHPVPGQPLGLPDTLRSLVADRISRVDPPVRLIAAGTAMANRLPADRLDVQVLEVARQESLVVIDDGYVRAFHPLVAAAAYESLSATERIGLHESLARGSTDPIERARHLALAVTEPRTDVAAALEAATRTAADRGATDAAADLARLAVARTPDGEDSVSRTELLADMLLRAGDTGEAVIAQRDAVARSEPGNARARQLVRLGEIVVEAEGWNAALAILQLAIDEPGIDPLVEAEAHLTVAAVDYDDLRTANVHAQRAMAIVEALPNPDPEVVARTLVQACGAKFRVGHGLDHERFRRAIDLERGYPQRRLSDRADASYGALLKFADDLTAADLLLRTLHAEAESSGDVSSIAYVRSHLPQVSLFRGDVAGAREWADAYLSLAESAALATHQRTARFLDALVAAYEGRIDLAGRIFTEEFAIAASAGIHWNEQRLYGAAGLLAWARGDAQEAVAHLDRWRALIIEIGLDEPGYSRYHLDYTEALVAVGRLDDAERFLDELADAARTAERAYAFASVATGRALLASARGDAAGAAVHIGDALLRYETLPLRFDRARCLFVAGIVARRARAKLAARELLTSAFDEFTAMGTPLWAARTGEALSRVNIRPPASSSLTATERRVAELAAQGLTNRQVAAAAFMSTKTVEANLARAYRKLGISSRAELGAMLGHSIAP